MRSLLSRIKSKKDDSNKETNMSDENMGEDKTNIFIKIIYFDEGSATDLIYILNGGKTTDKEEEILKKTTELTTGAEVKAKAKINILTSILAEAGVEADTSVSREGSSILSKAIESTVLTDYIRCADNEAKDYIEVFPNCMLYAYPESFTFYKMITPFLTMTDGSVKLSEGLNFNLSLMDQVLDSSRGYYELVVKQGEKKSILRFNSNAFRNNYSISDLIKMELNYHAIYVGKISEHCLEMKSEFTESKEKVSGLNIMKSETTEKGDESLDVFDVILAGVCR